MFQDNKEKKENMIWTTIFSVFRLKRLPDGKDT